MSGIYNNCQERTKADDARTSKMVAPAGTAIMHKDVSPHESVSTISRAQTPSLTIETTTNLSKAPEDQPNPI